LRPLDDGASTLRFYMKNLDIMGNLLFLILLWEEVKACLKKGFIIFMDQKVLL